MNARFCIFTFGRDAEMTAILVKYLRHCGADKVVVIDDGGNPFNPQEVEAVKALGAVYQVSSWKRGGNLNGKEAVQNVLTDLVQHSAGVEWVVKVDADTLPQREFFDFLLSDKEYDLVACGHNDPAKPIMGACYALRPPAVLRLQVASAYLVPGSRLPEDVTVGKLAVQEGLVIRTCKLGYQDYHRPGIFLKNVPSFAVCFGFVTDVAGNNARTKDRYGKFVAVKMQGFLDMKSACRPPAKVKHTEEPT